eukprot:215406_1
MSSFLKVDVRIDDLGQAIDALNAVCLYMIYNEQSLKGANKRSTMHCSVSITTMMTYWIHIARYKQFGWTKQKYTTQYFENVIKECEDYAKKLTEMKNGLKA